MVSIPRGETEQKAFELWCVRQKAYYIPIVALLLTGELIRAEI